MRNVVRCLIIFSPLESFIPGAKWLNGLAPTERLEVLTTFMREAEKHYSSHITLSSKVFTSFKLDGVAGVKKDQHQIPACGAFRWALTRNSDFKLTGGPIFNLMKWKDLIGRL